MKGKFERMLRILNLVDKRVACTPKSLAQDFEVDERTIYRYMGDLNAAGFPIFFDRDRMTYVFTEGFQLSKAHLHSDEALAMALAKRLLSPLGEGFERAFDSVEKKVMDLARGGKKVAGSETFVIACQETHARSDLSNLMRNLSLAVLEHRLVQITYEAMHSQERTERKVEPYYLYFSPDGFWNLRAYCRLRDEWRTFALDQVIGWEVLEERFGPKISGSDISNEVARGFETYVDGDPEEIVVQFSPKIRPFIERRTWHSSQKNRDLPDGWLEVTFTTPGIQAVKQWLYRWTPHIRVLSPEWLGKEMAKELRRQVKELTEVR